MAEKRSLKPPTIERDFHTFASGHRPVDPDLSEFSRPSIAGELYTSHDPRETAPKGRLCEKCGTHLSIYNETERCSLCKHSNIPTIASKKPRKRV